MQRFQMIELISSEDGNRKLVYDFNTKRYYTCDYTNVKTNPYVYTLVGILSVSIIEFIFSIVNNLVDEKYHIAAEMLFIVVLCAIATATVEIFLAIGNKEIMRIAVPAKPYMAQYASVPSMKKRVRTAAYFAAVMCVIIFLFACVALYADDFYLWLITSAIYILTYFIMACARPLLLLRYIKEIHGIKN